MDREDIIRMAKEAGFKVDWQHADVAEIKAKRYEYFAALVAAAEREKLAAWMMRQGYATGHGDTVEDLLQELDWQIKEKQEPVTFVCSTGLCRLTLTQTDVGIGDVQAIRARGER